MHVGLVEGVDAEQRPGDRDRELPAEELLAQIIAVCQPQMHNGLAGVFQRLHALVLLCAGPFVRPHIDEEAIPPIDVRIAQRLTFHRDDAATLFARALRNQLLDPVAKGRNRGRGHNGHLVVPLQCQAAHDRAEPHTRILARRHVPLARLLHAHRTIEQPRDIDADDRRRHESEEREGGIAAANVSGIPEDVAEGELLRHLIQFRARIGDGDELRSRLGGAERLRLGVEILELRERFERAPRFGGHQEERVGQVDLLLDALDGGGISGI